MTDLIEDDIEEEVCNYAKTHHLHHRKVKWVGRRGAPDRIFFGASIKPFFIEFKKPREKLRPDQVREVTKLRKSGATVYVVDSIQQGKTVIDREICPVYAKRS